MMDRRGSQRRNDDDFVLFISVLATCENSLQSLFDSLANSTSGAWRGIKRSPARNTHLRKVCALSEHTWLLFRESFARRLLKNLKIMLILVASINWFL